MKKALILCFSISLIVIFAMVNSIKAERRVYSEEKRSLVGEIVSVSHDYKTGHKYIRIDGEEIALSPDVKVYNENNALCEIRDLTLPYMARVIIVPDEEGMDRVIRIGPGEK